MHWTRSDMYQVMHSRLSLSWRMIGAGFIGRARTVQWMIMNYVVEEDPYGLEIEVVDSLKNGTSWCNPRTTREQHALGELMSTAAVLRGAVGCVCDSNIRDCTRIRRWDFRLLFSIRALDSKGRGRVQAYDVPIMCGEVLVHPKTLFLPTSMA